MTSKTMKSNGRHANGAQIERSVLRHDRAWGLEPQTSNRINFELSNLEPFPYLAFPRISKHSKIP